VPSDENPFYQDEMNAAGQLRAITCSDMTIGDYDSRSRSDMMTSQRVFPIIRYSNCGGNAMNE
jgi:hypothetical protein